MLKKLSLLLLAAIGVAKVELLLNRVDAIGSQARKYRILVKAILLQQQVEYP